VMAGIPTVKKRYRASAMRATRRMLERSIGNRLGAQS
jgi:hypothetical protein